MPGLSEILSPVFSRRFIPGHVLAVVLLLFAGLAFAEDGPLFSVLELPPIEGSDQAQVAVKWSGELPARLQPGYQDKHGRFITQGADMRLDKSMNLLLSPPESEHVDRAWQVVNADGQVLAQQRSGPTAPGWQPGYFLSPGVDGTVWAVAEFQGDPILAGEFLTAGDQVVNRIARWDGTDWSALSGPSGTGMNNAVSALTANDGALIAGGGFTEAGGLLSFRIGEYRATLMQIFRDRFE